MEYDPWGKVSREEGTSDPSRRFTGQQLDPESGLYYYGGRYYDPELGRFISPDPFVGQPDDPQSLNRYSYVINNPANNIDPDGYFHQVKKKKKSGGFFGIFRIIIGVFQLLSGDPSGLLNIASGASSFSSSRGAQIFSHVTGFLGALGSLGGGGPGDDFPGSGLLGLGGLVSTALEIQLSPALAHAAGSSGGEPGCGCSNVPMKTCVGIGLLQDSEYPVISPVR